MPNIGASRHVSDFQISNMLRCFETTSLQDDCCQKSRPNFGLFQTPCKIRGGMGKMSGWIFQAQPKTQPVTHLSRDVAARAGTLNGTMFKKALR